MEYPIISQPEEQITKWELKNQDRIIKWEVIYGVDHDTIYYYLPDKFIQVCYRKPMFTQDQLESKEKERERKWREALINVGIDPD